MARETSLWAWLNTARNTMREDLDMRRVEDMMGAGFPDVDGFAKVDGTGYSFKLELKSEVRPFRSTTPIRFKLKSRDAQIEFMRRRYFMGESAYFLLQVGEGRDRFLYLAPGSIGAALKVGITEAQLAITCEKEYGAILDGSTVKPHHVIKRIVSCYRRRPLP